MSAGGQRPPVPSREEFIAAYRRFDGALDEAGAGEVYDALTGPPGAFAAVLTEWVEEWERRAADGRGGAAEDDGGAVPDLRPGGV